MICTVQSHHLHSAGSPLANKIRRGRSRITDVEGTDVAFSLVGRNHKRLSDWLITVHAQGRGSGDVTGRAQPLIGQWRVESNRAELRIRVALCTASTVYAYLEPISCYHLNSWEGRKLCAPKGELLSLLCLSHALSEEYLGTMKKNILKIISHPIRFLL